MLPGRPYLREARRDDARRIARPTEVCRRRQQPRPPRRKDAASQRDRRLQSHARSPVAFDAYADNRDMGSFIVIDRFTNQHRRRRHAALRAAPLAEHPLAGDRGRQGRARAAQRPSAVRVVVDRPFRQRQIDDREHRRAQAACARRAHLPARRRQRASRPQQGSRLHRRGSRREHPPHRRGRQAHGRRRPDRDHRVHLAVPLRAAAGAQHGRRSRVRRDLRRHAARRSSSSAIRKVCTRKRAAASSRTSPASIRRTRCRKRRSCTSAAKSTSPKRPRRSSSSICASAACSAAAWTTESDSDDPNRTEEIR